MVKKSGLLTFLILAMLVATASAPAQENGSEDSGLFWFFQADNWEVLVKVLDGCKLTNHFWVFAAATTNVEYELTVTDVVTGDTKSYTNPLGTSAPALTDTMALGTCSAATSLISCAPSDTELCLRDRFVVRVDWRDFQGETGVGHVVPITRFEPQLRIFVNPADLYVTGTSEVVVVATGSAGEPLRDRKVRLFADSGTIERDLVTDSDGEATAVYTAGMRPGIATITALLGATSATSNLTVRDAPAAMVLTATPAVVGRLGGDIEIEAVVVDPLGLRLGGVVVTFTVTPSIGSFLSGSSVHVTSGQGTVHDTLLLSEEDLTGLTDIKISARVNSGESVLEDNVIIAVLD